MAKSRIEIPPYAKLAEYYDYVMEHVDYEGWADYVLSAAYRHGLQVRSIADLACGTGLLAAILAEKGFEVTACDGSAQMVARAKSRRYSEEQRLRFHVCDLREKPPVKDQDLLLCLYDSVNYLMEEEDLPRFFASSRSSLASGGLFIFDCSTERNSLNHFDGYHDRENCEGAIISRHAYYNVGERIQHNDFEIEPHDEKVVYIERHRQRIWPVALLVDYAERSGFELLAMYDRFSFSPGGEMCDRVHFVAKRV